MEVPEHVELRRLLVPTVFGKSLEVTGAAVEEFRPDVILCVGQAGGRSAVTPERVAVNVMDASIADNAGVIPVDQPIVPGGEDGLFATVPVKAMALAIREAGIPAQVSNTAGTFVCNQLLYGVLKLCRDRYPRTRAGFIHLPFLPRQVVSRPGTASMCLEDMVRALEQAISVL